MYRLRRKFIIDVLMKEVTY